jgi:excisionase family DNA binding protein
MDNKPLTLEEACEYLSMSKQTLYLLTSKKELRFFKPGGKKLYFRKEDLDEYVNRGMIKPNYELEKEG